MPSIFALALAALVAPLPAAATASPKPDLDDDFVRGSSLPGADVRFVPRPSSDAAWLVQHEGPNRAQRRARNRKRGLGVTRRTRNG